MKNTVWVKAIESSAAPARAKLFFESLAQAGQETFLQKASDEQARMLAALFSGSQALGNLLLAHPDWLAALDIERLRFPRREQGLRNDFSVSIAPLIDSGNSKEALRLLREFKQREMLRVAARDLARLGNLSEITREISDVADVCLNGVWEICLRQFTRKFGEPWHQDAAGVWQQSAGCVLGMGKLGGQELNYSSDVDVLFVYGEEGQVFKEPPVQSRTTRPVIPTHQFFSRVAEAFIAEVSRITPDGTLFRIDLRLRPEGDSGPLCRSLGSYENYYAQWGQTWERMMLIKARRVAGDHTVAAEFLEMIQPFRYPRAISGDVLKEIGAMKDRIENEVLGEDELERNVKLGRGGIREIEFIAQAQQLLHAGRQPFLQGAQTLPVLEKLAQYNLIATDEASQLREAYCFLRDVEHRLQMEQNLQTHTIPKDRASLERLAKLMGFGSGIRFEATRRLVTQRVRGVFDQLFKSEGSAPALAPFPHEFERSESKWKQILSEHSFRDSDKAFRVLREFVEGPGYVHVSPRTVELAHKLLPKLFELCPKADSSFQVPGFKGTVRRESEFSNRKVQVLSDPDRVMTRLDSFIVAYGARAVLFELWNSHPTIFELLLLLFDRSEFLAELAIRTPDLVDELVTSGRLRQRKAAEETLRELQHGLRDKDQRLWLRQYHQAELMRIGLRDILGLADPEQYLTELSALADACVQYALEVTIRKHKLAKPPLVVVGLGKWGGREIDYGSDLDVVFVSESKTKSLQRLQKIALEIIDLVSSRTEKGIVFRLDTRLRPDGEKGLLVNTLGAYEEYYRQRAHLWEIQSLTRTRPIAGNLALGEQFQAFAAALTNFKRPGHPPAAFSRGWKEKIHKMRMRIEKERTPAGKDELAIKTGCGGLMDAEFVAQALCLENGWLEANTLRALERGRYADVLPDADRLIQNYRRLRRVEGILRRWSYEGETVLPDDPAPYYRVSVRCGFTTADEFRQAMAECRAAIRSVYLKVFPF